MPSDLVLHLAFFLVHVPARWGLAGATHKADDWSSKWLGNARLRKLREVDSPKAEALASCANENLTSNAQGEMEPATRTKADAKRLTDVGRMPVHHGPND